MGLLNKKDEDADQELLEEAVEEEAVEPEVIPEVEIPAAVTEAHDGAKVCILINNAIQSATDLTGNIVPTRDNLDQIKADAKVHAARAQGTWMAVDNGSLEAGALASADIGIFADAEKLGELAAAIIVDARNQLQDLLGMVEQASADTTETKKP